MKSQTLSLSTLILIALHAVQASGQAPHRQRVHESLQPIQVQDLSDGRSSVVPGAVEGAAYFDDDDDQESDLQLSDSAEDQESPEVIPLSEDSEREQERDEPATSTLSDTTQAHLRELRKSIQTIQLTAGINRSEIPDNQAASVVNTDERRLVTSGGTLSLPQRYTICQKHRPLYFEDANLERCGNACGCLQNVCSGIRFFAISLKLPYEIGRQCPDKLVCGLGDCKQCQSFPRCIEPEPTRCQTLRGSLTHGAVMAGFTFLFL